MHDQAGVPFHFKLSILVDVAQGLQFLAYMHGQVLYTKIFLQAMFFLQNIQ